MNKCIDCGKELSKWSKYEKNVKCRSCSHKGQSTVNHQIDCKCGVCKAIRGETIGIKRKPFSIETKIKMSKTWREHPENRSKFLPGLNNVNYVHGKGYAPYTSDFTKELKEQIRKRDDYQCQNCNMTEEEHLIVIGTSLEIHHIDYDKNNCSKYNLITLCKQCNLRANINRYYWKDFYHNKIMILTENGGITNGAL